jgi:hypothetical protein
LRKRRSGRCPCRTAQRTSLATSVKEPPHNPQVYLYISDLHLQADYEAAAAEVARRLASDEEDER